VRVADLALTAGQCVSARGSDPWVDTN